MRLSVKSSQDAPLLANVFAFSLSFPFENQQKQICTSSSLRNSTWLKNMAQEQSIVGHTDYSITCWLWEPGNFSYYSLVHTSKRSSLVTGDLETEIKDLTFPKGVKTPMKISSYRLGCGMMVSNWLTWAGGPAPMPRAIEHYYYWE